MVPEVFSRVRRGASSAAGRRHERRSRERKKKLFSDLTGNRAWKASGTQGMDSQDSVLSVGSIVKLRGKDGLKAMAENINLMKFCIENMLNPFL